MTKPAGVTGPSRLPAATFLLVLLASLIAHAMHLTAMGGCSDDVAHAASMERTPLWQALRLESTGHHPRPVGTALLLGILKVLGTNWPALHAVTVALFLLGLAAVMLLVWRWTASAPAVAAAGLLYGLHPAISDWTNLVVCTTATFTVPLLVGAFLALTEYAEDGRRRWLAAAGACCFVCFTSYEQHFAFAPALAVVAFAGRRGRRFAVAAVMLAVVAAGALAFQRLFRRSPHAAELALGGGFLGRLLDTFAAAGRVLTVGSPPGQPAYQPAHSLAGGWAAITHSSLRLAAYAIGVGAVVLALFGAARRPAAAPTAAAGRRRATLLGAGLLGVVGPTAIFALRTTTPLATRHVALPLAAMATVVGLLTASLHERARAAGAAGWRQTALTAWLTVWALFGVTGLLANVGDTRDFAASWRHQRGVAAAIAACHDRPVEPDSVLVAEDLPSHVGRAPAFADEWSLGPLLQLEARAVFGQTTTGGVVTAGVETLPDDQLARTYAYAPRGDGMAVRDAIRFWRNGAVEREIPLPRAASARCPRAPLDLQLIDRPGRVAFGEALGLLSAEIAVRPNEEIPLAEFLLRVAPAAADRGPLRLRVCPLGATRGRCAEFVMKTLEAPGGLWRLRVTFQHGEFWAGQGLELTVLDRAGVPLRPESPDPLERSGAGVVLRWPPGARPGPS